jgi:PAS domain S-box-containing protein
VANDTKESSVLIVDDSPEHLRLLGAILKRGGLQPRPVTSGRLAIEAAAADPPDLVLLDVAMPEMSGLDVCRQFKQDPRLRDIPIIFVSSLQGVDDKVEALRAGGVDYVCKPFQEREVLERIKIHLRFRQLHLELMLKEQRVRKDLGESQLAFQAMFEQVAVGMAMVDADGKMLRVNRRLCEIVGYTADEMARLRFQDLTHPDDLAVDVDALRELRSGAKSSHSRQKRYFHKNGDIIWIKLFVGAVRDAAGHLEFFVSVFEDITEAKEAENRLRESEEKYRCLFESSRDALMTLEPPTWRFADANPATWRFADANPATLAMFRAKSAADFTSCGTCDLSPGKQPDGRASDDAAQAMIGTAIREGSALFDWTHKRFDGQEFPCTVLLTRMERGGRQSVQATVRDLSEQRQTEIDLAHARKLEAIGQLAAGIAHEINTPTQYVGDGVHFLKEAFEGYRRLVSQYQRAVETLGAAGGSALTRGIRETEEEIDLAYLEANVPGSFESCQEGISRISTIVRAMKAFSHPDQREKALADLNQALQTTLAVARNEYKYVAEIVTEFGDLPAVLCHVGALNQVFLNLIVNAAHAIGDVVALGGNKGKIHIKTLKEGDLARIDISDTWSGIPEAIRQRIFEPFFTTKEVGKGTGQGLAIAHSIVVTKHLGSLTFESEVGKGTTFTIRLPIGGAKSNGNCTSSG